MSRLIKEIRDGSIVEFDRGVFDDWCVYLTRPNETKFAPKDIQYFTELKNLGKIYGNEKIYNDFVKFYDKTSSSINPSVNELITKLSLPYNNDGLIIDVWFSVMYGGMIAEENKRYAILKKRIKRLGLYQVLIDGLSPDISANFSRGKKWRELDKICKTKGF